VSGSAWFHPVPLAGWLGHGLGPQLVGRMVGFPRLDAHLRRLVDSRLGVPAPTPSQATALGLDELGLYGLAHQAGAAWHGRSVARAIDGPAVRALVAAIGPALRLFAIRHALLVPGDPLIEAPDPGNLPDAIAGDGLRCLVAWAAEQPEPVGRRILLRLPVAPEPEPAHRAAGPGLVDTLLEGAA
jgi:hypothetical protein